MRQCRQSYCNGCATSKATPTDRVTAHSGTISVPSSNSYATDPEAKSLDTNNPSLLIQQHFQRLPILSGKLIDGCYRLAVCLV